MAQNRQTQAAAPAAPAAPAQEQPKARVLLTKSNKASSGGVVTMVLTAVDMDPTTREVTFTGILPDAADLTGSSYTDKAGKTVHGFRVALESFDHPEVGALAPGRNPAWYGFEVAAGRK